MNDAQTWTLIGGFLAIVTFMSALLLKIVDTKIEALGNRVDGKIDGGFERLNGRINVLGEKVDNIDRDVQAITAHLWGGPPQQQPR